jgi:MtaA/CmuA family methyltransferase
MNGYKWIKAALNNEWADTVPIMLHNFMSASFQAGYTQNQYRNDPDLIAKSFIQAIEKYQYDGILVEIDTATLAGAVGVPVDFPENEPARCHIGKLKTLDEVNNLERVNIEDYKYIKIWLEAVRILKQYFKDEIYIRGNCDQAPFSLASMMRTPLEWMMDLCDEENGELVVKLLEYCTDATKQFITLMEKAGAHMVSNGDSPAGPEMISPYMYEKFALPYEKSVVDHAHMLGMPYTLHICGNTSVILEKMLRTGSDAFELDYKTDMNKAHDLLKDKAVFIGNIDPSGIITFGSVEEVRAATIKLLDVFSDTPGFILNSGCAIPRNAPSENIKAMIETAGNYRK